MPFKDVQLDDDVVNSHDTFISPVHASRTFVIPSHSEILVPGRLDDLPASVVSINGMLAPRTNLCHRYSVFGASELVTVADDGTVPVRKVNSSSQPVTIYRRTRLANFEDVDQNIATFEITASDPKRNPSLPDSCSDQFEQCDYSELPDLSESVLSDGDRILILSQQQIPKLKSFGICSRSIVMFLLFLGINWVELPLFSMS